MKIIFSILINSFILYLITYLLNTPSEIGITIVGGWKTYIIGGIILGVINITVKPIIKILSLPLFFVFFGLMVFIVNGVILKLLDYIINHILIIPGVSYTINGTINFIIAVAIFTVLNMFYSLLFSKK